MNKQVQLLDLGVKDYKECWDYQEDLFQKTIALKLKKSREDNSIVTPNYLLLVEHPHVFTLGKSGDISNLITPAKELEKLGVTFYKINRG